MAIRENSSEAGQQYKAFLDFVERQLKAYFPDIEVRESGHVKYGIPQRWFIHPQLVTVEPQSATTYVNGERVLHDFRLLVKPDTTWTRPGAFKRYRTTFKFDPTLDFTKPPSQKISGFKTRLKYIKDEWDSYVKPRYDAYLQRAKEEEERRNEQARREARRREIQTARLTMQEAVAEAAREDIICDSKYDPSNTVEWEKHGSSIHRLSTVLSTVLQPQDADGRIDKITVDVVVTPTFIGDENAIEVAPTDFVLTNTLTITNVSNTLVNSITRFLATELAKAGKELTPAPGSAFEFFGD